MFIVLKAFGKQINEYFSGYVSNIWVAITFPYNVWVSYLDYFVCILGFWHEHRNFKTLVPLRLHLQSIIKCFKMCLIKITGEVSSFEADFMRSWNFSSGSHLWAVCAYFSTYAALASTRYRTWRLLELL